jgi:protein TonB
MTRAMPFHSPRGLQPERILGIAFALLAHSVLLMLLFRPPEFNPPVIQDEPVVAPPWKIVHREIRPDPIPAPRPRADVHPQPQPPLTNNPPQVISKTQTLVSTTPDPIGPVVIPHTVTVNPSPAESSLTPIVAPSPIYPREALYEGVGGTVELELLVGVDGRVIEARVVRSSGNRLLDNAARETVLQKWRFQAATLNGEPVQALGRLPVVFTPEDR